MPVWTTLECSTGNVTEMDCEVLQEGGNVGPLIVYVAEPGDGIVIRVWPEPDSDANAEDAREESGLSPAFWGLYDHARGLDCRFIRLHRDADAAPGMPVFVW